MNWQELCETMTPGERLELIRRRSRWTQDEAAERYGVTPYVYRRWERDMHRAPLCLEILDVTAAELCYVQRRRSGLTLHELADRMGLSHKWIHRAERGEVRDVAALVVWWEREALEA